MDTNLNHRQSNLAKPNFVKIRRKRGARGFYHKNRIVEEGETIECDAGAATMLVNIGKAERV